MDDRWMISIVHAFRMAMVWTPLSNYPRGSPKWAEALRDAPKAHRRGLGSASGVPRCSAQTASSDRARARDKDFLGCSDPDHCSGKFGAGFRSGRAMYTALETCRAVATLQVGNRYEWTRRNLKRSARAASRKWLWGQSSV